MRIAPIALGLLLIGCRPMDAGAPIDDVVVARGNAPPAGLRVGKLRVIDGDTFEVDGETIRIANIDTPEMAPRAKCLAEANLAEIAKGELDGILGASWSGSGSAILPTIDRGEPDRYGRTLARVVAVSGKDVGQELVTRGVAVPWAGRRADWCGSPSA
jgi:micrococcal nuclease